MKLILLIFLTTLTFSFTSCSNSAEKNKTEIISDSYFVNTTWLLESINGEKINFPADYKQNYIIFSGESEGFKIQGFSGCNNFSGKYDVGDHNEIGIENIASTKMMCSFSELENKYIQMLKSATSYKIEGYFMTVFSGDKKIAKFKDAKELRIH